MRQSPVPGVDSGTMRQVCQISRALESRGQRERTRRGLRGKDADVDRNLGQDAWVRRCVSPACRRSQILARTDVTGEGGWSNTAQVQRYEDGRDTARCDKRRQGRTGEKRTKRKDLHMPISTRPSTRIHRYEPKATAHAPYKEAIQHLPRRSEGLGSPVQ